MTDAAFNGCNKVPRVSPTVGDFLKIVESQAAHTGPIPVYDDDGHRIHEEPRPHH